MRRYRKTLFLTILLLVMPVAVGYAQEQDTVKVAATDFSDMTVPIQGTINADAHSAIDSKQLLDAKPTLDYPAPELPEMRWYGMPKTNNWQRWATGYFYGGHNYAADFLYGYVARTDFGIHQQLGDHWSVNAGIGLQKNSVYFNTATFNGSVTYHPVDWFAVTAFGSYSPGSFMSSYQFGPQYNWGGYVTFQTQHMGIDLGARQTYDPFAGHEVTPIIMPYFRMGDAKLGIDFGPMIKNLIDRNRHSDFDIGNPIPRPIKALPPVAPRR